MFILLTWARPLQVQYPQPGVSPGLHIYTRLRCQTPLVYRQRKSRRLERRETLSPAQPQTRDRPRLSRRGALSPAQLRPWLGREISPRGRERGFARASVLRWLIAATRRRGRCYWRSDRCQIYATRGTESGAAPCVRLRGRERNIITVGSSTLKHSLLNYVRRTGWYLIIFYFDTCDEMHSYVYSHLGKKCLSDVYSSQNYYTVIFNRYVL